jgi:phosphate transport system substrate-binding protein
LDKVYRYFCFYVNKKKVKNMNYKMVAIIEAVALIAIIIGFAFYSVSAGSKTITVSGTGSTFVAPLVQKWSEGFNALTGAQVNYEGTGSGTGVKQFTNKTVDFGASDPPMKDSEFAATPGALHLPETVGGTVVIYNIANVNVELNFTGEVLAGIFMLNLTSWNDARLVKLNPGVSLPNQPIYVVHRSDSSGTTKIFTSFLSDTNAVWNKTYGASNTINWPATEDGEKGSSNVAGAVERNSYSIGYVELQYALSNGILYGKVWNSAAKEYVEPTFDTLEAAVSSVSLNLPHGNQSWAGVGSYFKNISTGYPITSFSYILVYRELNVVPGMTLEKAKTLTWFLWFAVHDGQSYSRALSYVPLPQVVVTLDEATLRMITFNGQQVNNWS